MKVDFSEEKELEPVSGMLGIMLALFFLLAGAAAILCSALLFKGVVMGLVLAVGILSVCLTVVPLLGLKVVAPKEALVLVLFGNYYRFVVQGKRLARLPVAQVDIVLQNQVQMEEF